METTKKLGFEDRFYLSKFFKELALNLEQLDEPNLYILDLPAGYGKSTATTVLARLAIEGNPYFSRVIHVLPMRSIIDDLYMRVRECVGNVLGASATKNVAAQYMLTPGSPLFFKRCIVTTLDSFILNFFKLPAYELAKAFDRNVAHFEHPRAMIYTSIVVLDEFHLLSGLGSVSEEMKSITAVLAAIISMLKAGISVVVMTATLPKPILDLIENKLSQYNFSVEKIVYTPGEDQRFDEKINRKQRLIHRLTALSDLDLLKFRGLKVALIFNTVDKAVECYRRLKQEDSIREDLILAHGRLPESRRSFLTDIRSRSSYFVVATQVIEAGVDVNFDVMITECCPADRLVQRAGRVARNKDQGEIWVLKLDDNHPYDKELVDITWNYLKEGDNLTYVKSKELIERVFSSVGTLRVSQKMFDALKNIDSRPIFGLIDAKNAYLYFQGFTNSAGIISGYKEDFYNPKEAVPLSEKEVLKLSTSGKLKVLKNIKSGETDYMPIYMMKPSVALYLLREGYRGVVIDANTYDSLIGLN